MLTLTGLVTDKKSFTPDNQPNTTFYTLEVEGVNVSCQKTVFDQVQVGATLALGVSGSYVDKKLKLKCVTLQK